MLDEHYPNSGWSVADLLANPDDFKMLCACPDLSYDLGFIYGFQMARGWTVEQMLEAVNNEQ